MFYDKIGTRTGGRSRESEGVKGWDDAGVPQAKERLRSVLSLAPGNVYRGRKSKTA